MLCERFSNANDTTIAALCEEILLCKSVWPFELVVNGQPDTVDVQRDTLVLNCIWDFANGTKYTTPLTKLCQDAFSDRHNGAFTTRSPEKLQSCILGLFEICIGKNSECLPSFRSFVDEAGGVFFNRLLELQINGHATLRERMLDSMERVAGLEGNGGMISQLVRERKLMRSKAFYSIGTWDLFRNFAPTATLSNDPDMLRKLLISAEVCDDLSSDSINDVLRSVGLCEDTRIGTTELKRLLAELARTNDAESAEAKELHLSLSDLSTCMRNAVKSLRKLNTTDTFEQMQRILSHYAEQKDPSNWPKLYSDSLTVAYFIKYSTRERLHLAYVGFETPEQPSWFQTDNILSSAAKNQFEKSIVDVNRMRLEDYDDAIDTLLRQLREDALNDAMSPEMQVLHLLVAQWLEHGHSQSNTPLSIHHTQSICYLILTKLMRDAQIPGRNGQCAIAKVGTGEGKSLIIAMLAVYAVLVHKKKVHIVSSNAVLRDRDLENYKKFFNAFVKDVATGEHISSGAWDASSDTDIMYCLYIDIASQYIRKMSAGHATDYKNYILILDEVDEMIVDKAPVTRYVKEDVGRTTKVEDYFNMVKAGTRLPTDASNADKFLFTTCQDAVKTGENMKEGKNYAKKCDFGGQERYYLLDERNRFQENTTALKLQYLNTKLGLPPKYESPYQVICKPSVLQSYSFIVGLTGSTGGQAEEEFLKRTYKAKIFV